MGILSPMEEKFTLNHDFVFAGGALLRIGPHILTASDVFTNKDDKVCVNLRVNKQAREDYFVGNVLEFADNFRLKITKLDLGEGAAKGRIFLKKQA